MAKSYRNGLTFWLFLLPALLAFLLVVVIPFFMGVVFSFTDWTASARLNATLNFVGWANYLRSFRDPSFLHAFLVTSVYTLVNMLLLNLVALGLALLVSRPLMFQRLYRAGFFLPNLIGGLVLGFVWQFIFSSAVPGLFAALRLNFFSDPERLILANPNSALMALVLVSTWQYAGYLMMIYLAGLTAIPGELLEAAKIDGARPGQILRSIKLPLIRQAATICLFLALVNSFKQFDVNVSLTAGGPSTIFLGKAIYSTELLALDIYNSAFVSSKLAEGQARAVIFFIVLLLVAIIQVVVNKRKEIEL